MRRLGWLFTFALLLPQTSSAIQLRWSDGSSNLTFGTATRCTLVVAAEPAEVTLPGQWRLLWLADSSGVTFVEEDSIAACLADTARVSAIEPPATTADSAAHQITTRFCSANETAASVAIFVLDQPGWSKGNLKVVAIDPADLASTRVIESNEVTYNGGVEGTYAPNILATTQSRQLNTVLVEAIGTGLNGLSQARIVAPDTSWTVPLNMLSQTGSSLAAAAEVPASLSAAMLELSTATGTVAAAPLAGDTPLAPQSAYSYGSFVSPIPGRWRPKDFTLFYDGLGKFHLFFMRQEVPGSDSGDAVQRAIGHVTSGDLRNWSPVRYTLSVQPSPAGTGWDRKFLWAPFLYQHGGTYYLFYTGVADNGDQSIGVTTTTDINNPAGIAWDTQSRAVARVEQPSWAWVPEGWDKQCRDPFVMRSAYTGDFYMFFSTTRENPPAVLPIAALGVARSTDLLNWTVLGDRLAIVDEPINGSLALQDKAESPHAFLHVNRHATADPPMPADTSYYLLATSNHGYPQIVALLRNRQSPWDPGTDTGSDHWQHRSWLYDELGLGCTECVPQDIYNGWEATEHWHHWYTAADGREKHYEYMAGINYTNYEDWTAAIWIVMLQWVDGGAGPDQMTLLDPVTDVGERSAKGAELEVNALRLMGRNPAHDFAEFEMALAGPTRARLAIFDAQGRCIRTVAEGFYSTGRHIARWDSRDATGRPVGSGIYFARLEWEGGRQVVRCLILR